MKAIEHNPLPLATTSALTPRSLLPQSGGKLAWREAFTRAAKEAVAVFRLPRDTAQQVPGFGQPPVAFENAVQITSAHPVRSMPPPVHADARLAPDASPPENALGCHSAATFRSDQGRDAEPPCTGLPRRVMRSPGERQPVRVHIEQHADGTAVWLGCDANAPAAHVAALLAAIKAQSSGAGPIASIVRNGVPVHARFPRSRETP